jgi:mRNA interferase MazF
VLLLAPAGYGDWIICQITSNPFSDLHAIPLTQSSFVSGGLRHTSYVRPSKLFTAHTSLIAVQEGTLNDQTYHEVREAVVAVNRSA